MPRTPFAIMFAMTSFLALPAPSVWAQAADSASDATTPMDKAVGNLDQPGDNTLSNDEVQQLKHQQNKAAQPGADVSGEVTPSVSGTTPVYKPKSRLRC